MHTKDMAQHLTHSPCTRSIIRLFVPQFYQTCKKPEVQRTQEDCWIILGLQVFRLLPGTPQNWEENAAACYSNLVYLL